VHLGFLTVLSDPIDLPRNRQERAEKRGHGQQDRNEKIRIDAKAAFGRRSLATRHSRAS